MPAMRQVSPESAFDYDVKRFNAYENPLEYLEQVEAGELSDAFWNNVLVRYVRKT